uniref:Mab-21 domain-containing protein n=1 Tax=Macrostomum lignano TaxID=282301 RepID=A0A1I8JA40_9PLAT
LLLLASNRQSWCSIRGRMKHLLQLSHRCWSSGGGARLDSQLAQWQSRVPPALNAPPVSSNARTWPHQSESQLPLVLMSAAKPPPEPQPSQKQQQKKERQRKQQQEDKEAIERLKIEMKRLQDRTTISYKNPCKVSANYKKTCTIDELNAVKYHFEEFLPRFFVSMMDYSLFTPDVVYINEMQTPHKTSKGVYRLSVDRVKLKLYYDLRYAMKKPVILRIDTDRENCCMAIRLRVRCVGGSKPFTDLARMNQLGTAAYIEEKGDPDAAAGRLSLLQRLRQLLRRRAPLPSAIIVGRLACLQLLCFCYLLRNFAKGESVRVTDSLVAESWQSSSYADSASYCYASTMRHIGQWDYIHTGESSDSGFQWLLMRLKRPVRLLSVTLDARSEGERGDCKLHLRLCSHFKGRDREAEDLI